MPDRQIYLRIEGIPDYSPVDPGGGVAPPKQYRRDCMRTTGHENATIPLAEVNARRVDALVYREYVDPDYLIPKPDKLIVSDVNEPVFNRRVPGSVIYAHPGDVLRIHVFNADFMPLARSQAAPRHSRSSRRRTPRSHHRALTSASSSQAGEFRRRDAGSASARSRCAPRTTRRPPLALCS
jgi:hypothetical protein